MSEIGWVKMHRKIRDTQIWDDKEPFDRRSAWMDLVMMVNHEDKEIIFNGKPFTVKRGQRITSIRGLAERWHWSVNRTKRYLVLLEQLEMIHTDRNTHRTLLTLVNYGFYQGEGFTDEHTNEHTNEYTDEHTDEYTDGLQTRNKRMNKNEKNEKNIYQLIADIYNATCVSFPKVVTISDARKKAIKARLKKYTLDDFQQLFTLAEASDFLKGGNDRNWTANFDWMITDSHMAKILEGQYKNRPKKNSLDDTFEMMRQWAEEGS